MAILWKTLRDPFSAVSKQIVHVNRYYLVNTRLKALDEIYKMYTYASLGEKNRIENEIIKMYTNKV